MRLVVGSLLAVLIVGPAWRGITADAVAATQVSLALPADETLVGSGTMSVSDEPPAPEELPTLERIRDETAAQADRLPEADWDLVRLAGSLDYDPEQAVAFVRDRIAFDPYPGVLRGPEGTLAARAGNAYDRALLLGALLDAMAVPYRLAFAELDDATAVRLVERALEPPAMPLPAPGLEVTPTIDPAVIRTRAERDYARLRGALGDRLDAMQGPDRMAALDAVRHHAWVQAAFGSEWRDLDPTLPDAPAGSSLAVPARTADAMPEEAYQTVTLRVVAESLDGGVLGRRVVMERRFPAADAAERRIFLYFQPSVGALGGAIVEALSGDAAWAPVLLVDDETEVGDAFRAGGRGTDVFGEPTGVPELASLGIEVEHAGPWREPVVVTRVLLDRVPATVRAAHDPAGITPEQLLPMAGDDGGPFVMGQVHHVMISTGGADRRDHALQRSWSADWVGTILDAGGNPDDYRLSDLLWPVAEADEDLVVASEAGIVPALGMSGAIRSYVSSPRVYLSTIGRDAADGSLAFATDLLIDGVALLPADPAAASFAPRLALWYGALQTALETQIALRHAAILDPADRSVRGASIGGEPLTLVTPDDDGALPDEAPAAMRLALAGGSLVLVRAGDARPDAWWTVDPVSGLTRSVLDPGLGCVRPVGSWTGTSPTFQSSHTHGAGPRLPPRPPMVRPPPGGYAPPASCVAGDSTGYVALTSCASVPVSIAWFLLAVEVGLLALLAAHMLS
jgi:hypothetical protein